MTDAPTQRVAGAPGATPGVTVGLSGSVGVAELKQRKVLRVAATHTVIAGAFDVVRTGARAAVKHTRAMEGYGVDPSSDMGEQR